MADINERLDRLQRRQEFDRFGRPLRHAPAEMPVGPAVARPAGVDDRLGEVLDAVASVVRRHPGLSVMVALADGRAGRPVIRVTERDGSVETGVVVVSTAPPRVDEPTPRSEPLTEAQEYGPYDGLSTPAAAPARESVPGSDPVFEPALRDGPPSRDSLPFRDSLPTRESLLAPDGVTARDVPPSGDGGSARAGLDSRYGADPRDGLESRDGMSRDGLDSRDGGPTRDGVSRDSLPTRDGGPTRDGMSRDGLPARDGLPSREEVQSGRGPARTADGRHAATGEQRPGAGWSGSSWHDALWSPESRDRFRQAEQDRRRARDEQGPAVIPLPEDTSQVVSRLAQLLRENPTLAASWSREAQE